MRVTAKQFEDNGEWLGRTRVLKLKDRAEFTGVSILSVELTPDDVSDYANTNFLLHELVYPRMADPTKISLIKTETPVVTGEAIEAMRARIETHRRWERPYMMELVDDLFAMGLQGAKHLENTNPSFDWIAWPNDLRQPQERRYVLVQITADVKLGMPPSVAVGYLRFNSDGKTPYFVVPGFGRLFTVSAFCDCLGDNFNAPLWEGKQNPSSTTADNDIADNAFLRDVKHEIIQSRVKFPAPDANFAALVEEVGEVGKALMYEPWTNVVKECVQVAGMALRFALEGDYTMEAFRDAHGNSDMPTQTVPDAEVIEACKVRCSHCKPACVCYLSKNHSLYVAQRHSHNWVCNQ